MQFLVEPQLSEAIRKITSQSDVSCAVAFWGAGAEDLFLGSDAGAGKEWPENHLKTRNIRVICDLMSGSTNPGTIRELLRLGVCVKDHAKLHAKVYICPGSAVVASANASDNGLGRREGIAPENVEAGALLQNDCRPNRWFEQVWAHSVPIGGSALLEADAVWRRRTAEPGTVSFDQFKPSERTMPLIGWASTQYAFAASTPPEVRASTIHNKLLEEMIEWGQVVSVPEEEAVLKRFVWVLGWYMSSDGKPDRDQGLYWSLLRGPVEPGVHFDDGVRDIYLGAKPGRNNRAPFNCSDPKFQKIFFDIILQSKYDLLRLRNTEKTTSFYNEISLEKMREFWQDVLHLYSA